MPIKATWLQIFLILIFWQFSSTEKLNKLEFFMIKSEIDNVFSIENAHRGSKIRLDYCVLELS